MKFYWFFPLIIFLSACDVNQQAASNKPNIILMIADDMGYGDLGCYGSIANTPNLDSLAMNGILLTDLYAAAPNCSPSRTGLLTGRSPAIAGMYNYRPPNHPMHLRDSEITIAEVLQEQGYSTSHFGKWHLGCLPQDSTLSHPQPDAQGFDYSFGTENNAMPSHLNPVNFVRNGKKLPEQKGYSCWILAEEAINWMEAHTDKNKPFFCYVAFHEPHKKVAAPPELVQKYPGLPENDAEYLACIENLDLAAGRIIDYLDSNKLLNNTLVIFASDNGSYRQASNGGLRAVKSYLFEGGIRVPGIIHWPALDKKESVITEPVGFVDIMPTICDILQIETPGQEKIDGTSILNLLNGREFYREKPLFWYFYRTSPEIAVRMDDLMILGKDKDTIPRTHRFSEPDMDYIQNMDLVDYELYDLKKDRGQKNNLINNHPDAQLYKEVINDKLNEIQSRGFHWTTLPEASDYKIIKTKWVPYEHH